MPTIYKVQMIAVPVRNQAGIAQLGERQTEA